MDYEITDYITPEEFYKKFGFVTRPNEMYGCGMCQWIQSEE